jgi:phosphoglycerate dehydrogenase-like enzyme
LRALLENTDYLALATPHTHETEGLLNASALAMVPPRAVLINIARGAVVDQAAMTAMLGDGRLRGAALDVFAVEPLPAGDPLWSLPNVIISPHSASTVESENRLITDLFIENIGRFLAGEPLINLLDVEKQY